MSQTTKGLSPITPTGEEFEIGHNHTFRMRLKNNTGAEYFCACGYHFDSWGNHWWQGERRVRGE